MTTNTEDSSVRRAEAVQWLEPTHSLGERLMIESDALRQSLAWQVAAELVRRHPKTLRLHMAYIHQYGPALIPMELRADGWEALHRITWGKGMHITPFGAALDTGAPEERFNWLDVLLAPNRREYVVAGLERQAGLTAPASTPETTRATIGIRVVAAFLSKSAIAHEMRWVAVNGVIEDDDGSSPAHHLFAALPGVQADWTSRDPKDEWATSRYWFILHNDGTSDVDRQAPVAAIDFVSGTLWSTDGLSHDLLAEYAANGRQVDTLVSRYLPPTQ